MFWQDPMQQRKTNFYWEFVLFAIGIAYIIFSFATISFYNLPFCDEVYYADAAFSYHLNGNFKVPIDFPRTSGEVFHVPLFLWLQSKVFDLVGFGIWQVRLLPVLAGMLVFIIYSFLTYRYTCSYLMTLLFVLLFVTDRAVNFNLHSGRMEMPSLLLLSLSMIFFHFSMQMKRSMPSLVSVVVASLLLSGAFLVSFRMAIAAIPTVLLLLAYRPLKDKLFFRNLITYWILAAIPVLIWLFIAYGNPLSAYRETTGLTSFKDHFGVLSCFVGNVLRRPNEAPKMLFFYACTAFLLIKHRQWIRTDFFVCMSLLVALGFVLFVTELGSYRATIFPFIYLIIVVCLSRIVSPLASKVAFFCVVLLILINCIYMVPRLLYWSIHWNYMDHNRLMNEIAVSIPSGSRVVSDPVFFYALRAAKCEVLIPYWEVGEYFEPYIKNNFKPDFILTSRDIFQNWFPDNYKHVATIGNYGNEPVQIKSLLRLETVSPETVYSGSLIKILE